MDNGPFGSHTEMVGQVHELSRRELFSDHRGVGLRVTAHRDAGVVVVSLWRDGTCTGTFHLDRADAARLATLLTAEADDHPTVPNPGAATGR